MMIVSKTGHVHIKFNNDLKMNTNNKRIKHICIQLYQGRDCCQSHSLHCHEQEEWTCCTCAGVNEVDEVDEARSSCTTVTNYCSGRAVAKRRSPATC